MQILSGRTLPSRSENSSYKDSGVNRHFLSHEEITLAIELLINRMNRIESMCGNQFPLYSSGADGHWVTSRGGSWTGGFWGGWWWLRARITQSKSDQIKAIAICRRLSSKITADSINRSFIFWYGAALGYNWFGDMDALTQVRNANTAIVATFNPVLKYFPLGTDMGGGEKGEQYVSIDSLAALIQLLGIHADEDEVQTMLRHHVDTILENFCDTHNQGAFQALGFHNGRKFTFRDTAGAWSRGQAWAMLGLCRATEKWGEPYRSYSQAACEYWRDSRVDAFPLDNLDGPDELRDPSSAVIASLAMMSLADQIQEGDQWVVAAHKIITDIVCSPYFSGFQDIGIKGKGLREDSGAFRGCCYKTKPGVKELAETPWGSFLLMAALCALAQRIKPNEV
ncbi:glucuronyl hydrolase [Nitrosomonas marina]|uniref:Unsaturated chondroitin disaccharide hydrolase n=1 Tax=Nitrosomonas marina TaxID=917 RepID=A0A1H8AG84_9PROT|nr:glucuronyl hydrolase [Nitrosomonas marina]SEM69573.1 unsaturated chondroitin disaccharide hydrolase [Nitrosomonas marina]